MNLGIQNKKAIVCAGETDLGLACAQTLASEGAEVFVTTKATASELSSVFQAEQTVTVVHCDITLEEGREYALSACPAPDILINHAPGPPMGNFRQWDRTAWISAIEANMLAAIELIGATLDGMLERGFGRIVNITSQSVKSPMANLDLSNAARAGLTGFVAGVAREPRTADVTINNLLPGMFETEPLKQHIQTLAKRDGSDTASITANLLGNNPLGRLGRPEEFGAICAFLCSPLAGYINAQNILLDGGTFRSVL